MVNTVGTYANFQSTLNDMSSVEGKLLKQQEQLSSGDAFQSFSDMGSQTQQYLSLTDTISQTNQYLANHQTVEANVNTTSSVLTNVITAANSLQSLIAQRMSGTESNGFSSEITASWQSLVGQLNTNVSGQYLFSGSAINTPPINDSTFPTLQTPGMPDAGYYRGNSQDLTTRIDNTTLVTYNIRANDPAFQQLFAGLAMAQQGNANNDTAALKQAENLVQQGIKGITALQASVGTVAGQLVTSDTNLNNQKLYYQGLQESIGNTDIVSVSTQVAVNQGVLQAAFEVFAKITSLQLSSYLK